MDLLAAREPVPRAAELPPGAVVLALDGTERADLRLGALAWGAALFGAGLFAGWLVWGRR